MTIVLNFIEESKCPPLQIIINFNTIKIGIIRDEVSKNGI